MKKLKLILGDSIVLWRTLVVYKSSLVPVVIPGLTWVGSVGEYIAIEKELVLLTDVP